MNLILKKKYKLEKKLKKIFIQVDNVTRLRV
jgi:hypothetical protein